MDPLTDKFIKGAAGVSGDKTYVDDVFAIATWMGDGTDNKVIDCGIDLETHGGMVLMRNATNSGNWFVFDTVRGKTKRFKLSNAVESNETDYIKSWTSTGFTLGTQADINNDGSNFIAYVFRNCPGFFEVVSYSGNSSSNQNISHTLGDTPGHAVLKSRDAEGHWYNFAKGENSKGCYWNDDQAFDSSYDMFGSVGSTTVNVKDSGNTNGTDYALYLWADDAQVFGTNGDESIVKAGTYDGNGEDSNDWDHDHKISLGWEPEWVLIRRIDQGDNWILADDMQGMKKQYAQNNSTHVTPFSYFNKTSGLAIPGASINDWIEFYPDGFRLTEDWSAINGSGAEYMYLAIRKNMHNPAENPTDCFAMDRGRTSPKVNYDDIWHSGVFNSGFRVDMSLVKSIDSDNFDWIWGTRQWGNRRIPTDNGNSYTHYHAHAWTSDKGCHGDGVSTSPHFSETGMGAWMWKRNPGSFTQGMYTGVSANELEVKHGLGSKPEMLWIRKAGSEHTLVYHKGTNGGSNPQNWYTKLGSNDAQQNDSDWLDNFDPATNGNALSYFKVGDSALTNNDGDYYLWWAFGSVPGISSVGSYTGTGGHISLNLGFTPRFMMIKRLTNDSFYWQVFGLPDKDNDNAGTGIVSGDDPSVDMSGSSFFPDDYNWVDPITDGIEIENDGNTVKDRINKNNEVFIYYAHA